MTIQNPASYKLPLPIFLLWRKYRSGGDLLLFIAISLGVAFFIGQEKVLVKGEPIYWAVILPAIVMPMIRIRATVGNLLFGRALPLSFFGAASCLWLVIKGDFAAVPQVLLFVWVAGWACRDEARIDRRALYLLALLFFTIGCAFFVSQTSFKEAAWLMDDSPKIEPKAAVDAPQVPLAAPNQQLEQLNINPWGILPGQTAPAFGPWRISATPNIATSGIFSLFVLLIALSRPVLRPTYGAVVFSAAYFALLSFVRTVFVSLALFFSTMALMKLFARKPLLRMAAAFFMVVGIVLLVAFSPQLLFHFQDMSLVSRLFLRGQTDLSLMDIYRQTYRPWLWAEHFRLFWHSDHLLGQGSGLAASASTHIINAGHVRSDSVSLLTRLLATYGLAAIGIFVFIFERAYRHASNNDAWGVAMLSVIVWLMMAWGSIFHPTNAFFVLAFAMIGKGSAAFSEEACK